MTSKSVLALFLLLCLGCASSKYSYEELRDKYSESIEVSIGSSIFGAEASRMLLTKEGKLISEKRTFFGSWKIKSAQISSSNIDSIFATISRQDFNSLPQNIDQNCYVFFLDRNQVRKGIGGTMTDQSTKSIRLKNPIDSKTIIWKECRPLEDFELDKLKDQVYSEDEFNLVLKRNEQISSNLRLLNNLLNTMFSLNN